MSGRYWLGRGLEYPFDAPDEWWDSTDVPPPPSEDWAQAAARGVVANLKDRRGIKQGFADLDEDVRREIIADLSDIIREARP